MTTITNFKRNPLLLQFLITYCKIHYQQDAELNENSLLEEYNLLLKENRLNDLFECEKLTYL